MAHIFSLNCLVHVVNSGSASLVVRGANLPRQFKFVIHKLFIHRFYLAISKYVFV